MEEEFDPYLTAFDNIKIGENNSYKNFIIQEDEKMAINNENYDNNKEDEDMKDVNNLKEEGHNLINNSDQNKQNKNSDINNNDINMTNEFAENTINYKLNESNNKVNILIPNQINKEEKAIIQKCDFDYSLIFLNNGENGFMEDFINENNNESTIRDCFNFNLNEKDWIKILNHTILVHYLKNIKEYNEKQKKMRTIMYNGNINVAGNPVLFQMNPYMINYNQNMNINNLKNLQINSIK